MRKVVVGISEMRVSESPEEILVTYSLGSCIGLTLFDPGTRVGGLLHCLLPSSRLDSEKARANPSMFADTGTSGLLQALFDRGASRTRLIAKVAGGAQMLDEKGYFNIGARNLAVLSRMLEVNGIRIAASETGGQEPRTLSLHMDTGRSFIGSGSAKREL